MKAVITGQDVAGLRIGRCIYDTPVLADGVVRFIGEKVAAVAAETRLAAEQALELIEVEYEELEPLLDPVEAVKDRRDGAASRFTVLQRSCRCPSRSSATFSPISNGARAISKRVSSRPI